MASDKNINVEKDYAKQDKNNRNDFLNNLKIDVPANINYEKMAIYLF